jgi:hypothetical protein
MEVTMRQGIAFIDYDPQGMPEYESDIAEVLGCSKDQTESLLRAVEVIEDDHHFRVTRRVVDCEVRGAKGTIKPAKIRVTITAA